MNATVDGPGISISQKPLCVDDNQCHYYLLNCSVRRISMSDENSLKMLRLLYLLVDFCYIESADRTLIQSFEKALKSIEPSWKKFNSLILHTQEEELLTVDEYTTTGYGTMSGPHDNDQFEGASMKMRKGSLDMTSTGFATLKKTRKDQNFMSNNICKTLSRYFTKISFTAEALPFNGLFRLAAKFKENMMRGPHIPRMMMSQLAAIINRNRLPQSLSVDTIQQQLLSMNMMETVNNCRKLYTQLALTIFLQGKSLPTNRLYEILTHNCQQVLEAFDHEFQEFAHLEEHEIHRSMIKRDIQVKEKEIHKLNSMIAENQCHQAYRNGQGRLKLLQFFEGGLVVEETGQGMARMSIEDQTNCQANPLLSLPALTNFLHTHYFQTITKDIMTSRQTTEQIVMRNLDYSKNPVELLRKLEQRLEYSRQKKKRMEEILMIGQNEIENYESMKVGRQFELHKERETLTALRQKELQRKRISMRL